MEDLDKSAVDKSAVEKKIVLGHMPWCPSIAASYSKHSPSSFYRIIISEYLKAKELNVHL